MSTPRSETLSKETVSSAAPAKKTRAPSPAAMGAVVAQRSDIIQNVVRYDPATKTYTVTFQRMEGGSSNRSR